MKAYIARLAGEGDRAGELVGIFCAENEVDLFWAIDECCDPSAVEVAELGSGGVFWDGPTPMKVPVPVDHEGEPIGAYNGLPPGSTFSDNWRAPVFDTDVDWRRLGPPEDQ